MRALFITLILSCGLRVLSQGIEADKKLNFEGDSTTLQLINASLDSLFTHLNEGRIDSTYFDESLKLLTIEELQGLKGIEENSDLKISNYYLKRLINLYPVAINQYIATIAYLSKDCNAVPSVRLIHDLMLIRRGNLITVSLPLLHITRNWKKQKVGNITYHYQGEINLKNASLFDSKNRAYAKALGVPVRQFNFYICHNYQEVSSLLGRTYDLPMNGSTIYGYGPIHNTIFGIQGNEDFSHDLVHHYNGLIRTAPYNYTAEEGLAYLYGNAYYTNAGKMIEQKDLLKLFNEYMAKNQSTKPLDLFERNTPIFKDFNKHISVKSFIAGLICREVVRVNGNTAIKQLVNCGEGTESFLKATERLIGLSRSNFDDRVRVLIHRYVE